VAHCKVYQKSNEENAEVSCYTSGWYHLTTQDESNELLAL
jgi:hypothetical protein